MATWGDVPHLTVADKEELAKSIPPYQLDARTKGIPMLGSGAIYPVAESAVSVEPFKISADWPKVYALDVGWNRTAAVWGAWDTDSDIIYIYSVYYGSHAEPVIHAEAIKSRGSWINGVVDPAARARGVADGQRLMQMYEGLGLTLFVADNSIDTGIQTVWGRLSGGGLKVFSSCRQWFDEFRLYRRDERGKIVKKDDHLMDATRYLIMSGLGVAATEPLPPGWFEDQRNDRTRSATTGY